MSTLGTPLIWPTTPLQQGLVALAELDTGAAAAYVGQTVVDVTGPVETATLREAVRAVIAAHPHLHAGLIMGDDVSPVQFIDADSPPIVDTHDAHPGEPLAEAVGRVAAERRDLPWRLDEPPLLRWDVVRPARSDRAPHHPTTVLVVSAHHAVLDGWSMPLLIEEVAGAYARVTGAASPDGPEAPEALDGPESTVAASSYGDHLAWLAAQDRGAAAEFWCEHLAGVEPSRTRVHPTAPTGPAGPTAPTEPTEPTEPTGQRRPRRLIARVPDQRDRLAARGLTPAALARTCWGLALDLVTGSQGTPFAVAVSTRAADVTGSDRLIGLTTDAVLVAERPDPAHDVLTAAAAAQRRWVATLPYQHIGLRGIAAALRTGELAGSVLAVEPETAQSFDAGSVRFAIRAIDDDTHYPLSLTVRLGAEPRDWEVELGYDARRVETDQARRLLAACTAYLTAAADDTPIAQISALTPDDDRLLARIQGRTDAPIRESALLPDALADVCARHPRRIALVDAGPGGTRDVWTFARLAAEVRAARETLLAQLPAVDAPTPDSMSGSASESASRPGRPSRVAIRRPRSARLVIDLLAALDAGAAVAVLDPALPTLRCEEVLADLGIDVLVTADRSEVRHECPRGAARRAPAPEDAACLVLTSGSTGRPKPVVVPHRALAGLLEHHARELHPGGQDAPRQVAHTAAFHFDAHWDALLALFAGHTVHVLADDLYLDPFALAGYVREHDIDYLDLTPTVWSALLAADAFTTLPRICVLGGEALPPDLWRHLRERTRGTGSVALNIYGPTEATVDAAWARLEDSAEPVVGRALGRTGLLVLDDLMRRVPPGTPGELYLTGPGLADGYLHRSGQSAARFVANPYPRRGSAGAVLPGDERMYRTGDTAWWTPDGQLALGGRTDGQLSLAGRRVEPGEIEAVLRGDPRVAQAAVVARDSVSGRGRLVAHVVPAEPAETAAKSAPSAGGTGEPVATDPHLVRELTRLCRDRLPAALVPAEIHLRTTLPLTPNGKLDRAALAAAVTTAPAPTACETTGTSDAADSVSSPGSTGDPGATGTSGTPTTPTTPTTLTLVRAAIAEVLGLDHERVGDGADFFALGGDSIAAIQVCSRLRARGIALRAGQLLAARTPSEAAGLARPAATDASAPADSGAVDLLAGVTADPWPSAAGPAVSLGERRTDLDAHLQRLGLRAQRVLPLSPTQLGVYVDATRLTPDPYRTTTTLRIDGPAEPGGSPTPGAAVTGARVDAAVAGWFARHESLRVAVWQGDLPEPVAVVLEHVDVPNRHLDATHLDAAGVQELLQRVERDELDRETSFAAGRLAGYTWVRATATTSYLVVSVHHLLVDGWSTPVLAQELRDALHDGVSGRDATPETVFADYLAWWASQDESALERAWESELAGAQPTLLGRGAGAAGPGRQRRRATIEPPDGAALCAAAAHRGTTPAAACQAAWAVVLAAATGSDDVTYLLASAGRPEHLPGIETAVGMFVTTRPVRLDASCPADLPARVAEATARTEIAAHLGLGRVPGAAALADTLLVVENYPRPQPHEAATSVAVGLVRGHDATTFPVTATVGLDGGAIALEVEIDPAQTDADPELLARAWALAVRRVLEQPHGVEGDGSDPDAAAGGDPLAMLRTRAVGPTSALTPVTLPASAPHRSPEAPGSGREDNAEATELVARVMADVLGVAAMPAGASFFEAGADSILAVRLVGALRGHGLRVGVRDVFAAPLAVDLAALASPETDARGGAQGGAAAPAIQAGAGSAALPATPAIAWYQGLLRRGGSGRGFQQLRHVLLPADTPVTAVGAAVQHLVERHDALRLAVGLDEVRVVTATPQRLAVVGADDLSAQLRRLADEIDPAAGDLVRWAVVPQSECVRVVALAHHLAVDAVSWGILGDELRALAAGAALPAAPSFAGWAHAQRAAVDRVEPTSDRWLRTLAPAAPLRPAARPDAGAERAGRGSTAPVDSGTRSGRGAEAGFDYGSVGAATELEVRLDRQATARLLAAGRRGWTVEALLAAALTAGRADDLVVEFEGHGRPTGLPADDPRATEPGADAIGWFTATWPVRLPGDPGAGSGPLRHLTRTARAVAAGRAHGPDYGLLRHAHPTLAPALSDAERRCPPQVLLNYLGSSVAADAGDDPAALEGELRLHADLPVSHPVEINAYLVPGAQVVGDCAAAGVELVARWQVAAPLRAAAPDLAAAWTDELRRLVGLVDAADPRSMPRAPSAIHDAVGLDADDLEAVALEDDPAVRAVWPPTPVQRGMIFHAVTAAGADPYTSVLDVGLRGELEPRALRRAIESVVADHPQLRLRVRWTERGPVLATVDELDIGWRELTCPDAAAFAGAASREAGRGFDLERGPLLRATLLTGAPGAPGAPGATANGEHRLLLTNHHVLLDGWSMPPLVDAVLERYAAFAGSSDSSDSGDSGGWADDQTVVAEPAGSAFDRHVAALTAAARADDGAALERRRALLAGSCAGPVTDAVPGSGHGAQVAQHATVPTATLTGAARRHGTTTAALTAVAWGAALAAYSGRPDAVTGTVVSGRDDAPGCDAAAGEPPLLGMLTDTVPLLVTFDGSAEAALRAVADQTAAALVEPPVGLAALSTALGRGLLFDSLLVVENYPTGDAQARAARAGLEITGLDGADATHYPLSLTVETDGPETGLRLEHDPEVLTSAAAAGLLGAVQAVITELARTGSGAPAVHLRQVATESLGVTTSPSEPAAGSVGAGARDDVDALTAVFAQLLAPGTKLDADANFFALGGDSILAMSLVTAARERGLAVRPGDVFVAPTPRTLAERATPTAPAGPATPVAATAAGHSASLDQTGGESDRATEDSRRHEKNLHDQSAALIDLDATGAAALDDLLRNL